jgi:hypothetical protein
MATKKTKAEWPFPADTAPKAKKPTKKELEAQKLAEQEKLIQTLKFTPRTYKVSMWGYGGETVMGTISREIYDYFKANRLRSVTLLGTMTTQKPKRFQRKCGHFHQVVGMSVTISVT